MTCVSPQSNRKHPRYIILKVSQNFSSRKPACALITRTEILTQEQEGTKPDSALMIFLFISIPQKIREKKKENNWGRIYLSRLLVAGVGSQILKVKSCLLFFFRTQSAGIAKGGILMICSLCCLVRQFELRQQNELILRCVLVLIENWSH